jgi:hypothetical protein
MEFFMKKSILASSIAAAVFGLGASGAHAVISVNTTGVGDMLLVPYFSAQAENATLLSITNTDTQNGKAVKVRFRGAANSDDILDFQVFLSPTDIWTANVSKGADGRAVLTTSDKSCTKPNVLSGTSFLTSRLNPALTGDALNNGTREGYIEILGMADIPPNNLAGGTGGNFTGLLQTPATDAKVVAGTAKQTDNPLFFATKHVKGEAPPCSGTAWTGLDTAALGLTNAAAGTGPALGLTPSTGKLMADWTIVNTVNAAAWGGQAIALTSDVGEANRVAASSNVLITYVPQTAVAVSTTNAALWSADPLFLNAAGATLAYNPVAQTLGAPVGAAAVVAPGQYDLPDLSTSFDRGALTAANAARQVTEITNALASRAAILNEFAVESSISGSTDWVFSMPTRRYSVAMAYSKITANDDGRRWNLLLNDGTGMAATPTLANQFQVKNTAVVNGMICVTGANPKPYDREEQTPTTAAAVVVSPSTLAGTVRLCGETSVLSFNNGTGTSGALKGSVSVSAIDVPYAAGWATMSVAAPNASVGAVVAGTVTSNNYPIAGGAFQRAAFGAQGFGVFRPYR